MSNTPEDTAKSSTENMASAAGSTTQKEERVEEIREDAVPESQKPPSPANSYEKDGFRTYGDGLNHDHAPPVSAFPPRSLPSHHQHTDTPRDVLPPLHVVCRNVVPLDQRYDSRLSLR